MCRQFPQGSDEVFQTFAFGRLAMLLERCIQENTMATVQEGRFGPFQGRDWAPCPINPSVNALNSDVCSFQMRLKIKTNIGTDLDIPHRSTPNHYEINLPN